MAKPPKTYRHLRGKIAAFAEEPEYQQLVDEKKKELLGTLDDEDANVNRLAALLVKYERDKKSLYDKYGSRQGESGPKKTDAEYELNIYRKALSQMFVSAAISQGVEEVRLSSGELVS